MEIITLLLGAVFFLGGLPLLDAQESTSGGEFTLEEITVTAEKHVQNVQKTSISLSPL